MEFREEHWLVNKILVHLPPREVRMLEQQGTLSFVLEIQQEKLTMRQVTTEKAMKKLLSLPTGT